jgi:biotin synthase
MVLTRRDALAFLRSELPAEEERSGLNLADARARIIASGRGRVYASIGVDSIPCTRNCRFCSHAAEWGVYPASHELSIERVLAIAERIAPHRPDWLTLRTTQDYPIARLAELSAAVRGIMPRDTAIVVNTGEFSGREADQLLVAGVTGVYHTFRLREGIDTGISPLARRRTLEIVRDSGLQLYALVEPVGPEHPDEELVEAAFRLKDFGVRVSGAMARVPVPGTPLAPLGRVSDERFIRTVAMTRLVSGPEVEAICVHPPLPAALRAGANVVVVDAGATPRDTRDAGSAWRGFDIVAAKMMLQEAGWTTRASADAPRAAVASSELRP